MAPLRLSALLLLAPLAARSTMYDIVMPAYRPPEGCECAAWNASTAESWAAGAVPDDAGSSCAMPAAIVDGKIGVTTSYSGPWCYCKGSGAPATCLAPESTPEQINLQLAEPSVVVVGFVTYEQSVPSDAPMAMFGRKGGAQKQVTGVSHEYYATWYSPPRNYSMHFVKFSGLQPRASYTYKVHSTLTPSVHIFSTPHTHRAQVRSGASGAPWSSEFTFRAPYPAGDTKVAIYGDMGHSRYNNMKNLQQDCAAGTIDAIVHMGDHCYDLGLGHDAHGDAYMNAFQPVLAQCPWLPVIGNHESCAREFSASRIPQQICTLANPQQICRQTSAPAATRALAVRQSGT